MFADPFSTPIDELFALLDQQAPGSPAIGGIASGGMEEGEIRLVLNQDIVSAGVVGVALRGGLQVRTVVSQGCQPIGERFVVTKVNRNVIQELGGVPPLERLESTLETLDARQRQQAARGLQVGIAMDEHQSDFNKGDFLIRGLLGADRQTGSLAIADFVQEGQTLQFHIRDAQTASEDFNGLLALERMMGPTHKPKGALLFSCNGRGEGFFESPHHDVEAVQRQMGTIPVAGFFAGGEIGPVGGKNYLHGYTASMALFYEKRSPPSLRNSRTLQHSFFLTILHFMPLKETPLGPAHKALKGKLVDFAGWLMPIQYSGVLDEYHAVRRGVGLFDVSHMGRLHVSGNGAESFLQWICTNDAGRLKIGKAQYSMVCLPQGGIMDDVFVYKIGSESFLVCVNASNREKIFQWFVTHQKGEYSEVHIHDQSSELAQIAIQGPASSDLLTQLLGNQIASLKPRECIEVTGGEFSGLLSRTGYTGEIGYEWYIPANQAIDAWGALLETGVAFKVKPAGLGSRDLLRLDVGYLLYGNDIDEGISPLEASAEWIVSWSKGDFQGKSELLKQKEQGLSRKLVGFELTQRGIPRHGMDILKEGKKVGHVTSGNFSPILQKGIGLGYLPMNMGAEGSQVHIDIRGKLVPGQVVPLPFYKRKKS